MAIIQGGNGGGVYIGSGTFNKTGRTIVEQVDKQARKHAKHRMR